MRFEDCFGYGRDSKCSCTTYANCENCRFYKNRKKADEDVFKAAMILRGKGLKPCIKTRVEYYTSGGMHEVQIMSTTRIGDV